MKASQKKVLIIAAAIFLIITTILIIIAAVNSKSKNTGQNQLISQFSQFSQARIGQITASNPKTNNKLVVDSVSLVKPGFVIIHEEEERNPGKIIGKSELLAAGTTEKVNIKLDREARKGETLFAIIYYDDDENGYFEYPSLDMPAQGPVGETALVKLLVE